MYAPDIVCVYGVMCARMVRARGVCIWCAHVVCAYGVRACVWGRAYGVRAWRVVCPHVGVVIVRVRSRVLTLFTVYVAHG